MSSARSRFSLLGAVLALAQAVSSDCVSYGIDFQNEGSYFINKASTENFTSVTEFEGCAGGYSDVLLVDPTGYEYICSEIPTTPDNTPELSSCPVLKNQLSTGEYIIILHGNNNNESSFAWQRNIYLTVGEQVTSTITSTVTWDITSTPIVTSNVTSTVAITETVENTQTITSPSATAHTTITPSPVTSWVSWVFTRTKQTWTKSLTTVTQTTTASCTIPPRQSQPDPPATYTPTGVKVAALESGTPVRARNIIDRPIDAKEARRMIREARRKRGMNIPARLQDRELDERAPDSATVFVTADTVVNTTITHTAPATTATETTLITETDTTTLPPSTVYSGKTTITETAPTPTKTRTTISYTTITAIKTLYQTWTYTTTVTPTASAPACTSQGGHFAPKPKFRQV